MRRPQVEAVLPGCLEAPAVVQGLPLQPVVAAVAEPAGQGRVGNRFACFDFRGEDFPIAVELLAGGVHPERRKEDLLRRVAVEAGCDLGQVAEVAVDEADGPVRVLDRAAARAAADVERALGQAEVPLLVDQQEDAARLVLRRGGEVVAASPCRRRCRDLVRVGVVRPVAAPVRIAFRAGAGGQGKECHVGRNASKLRAVARPLPGRVRPGLLLLSRPSNKRPLTRPRKRTGAGK